MDDIRIIKEHHCKILDTSKEISINKRLLDGKERWLWEQEKKGKISADEIKYCPYCGQDLERIK